MNQKRNFKKEKKTVLKAKSNPTHLKMALIGFRGVGKSSISRALSDLWNVRLISMDKYIEIKEEKSIEEIVKLNGWPYFRNLELICLKEITSLEEFILLDTGGGILDAGDSTESEEKISILKNNFFSIYLFMDDSKIFNRLQQLKPSPNRPSLNENPEQTLVRRKKSYLKAACAIVDISDCSVTEAAERVFQIAHSHSKKNH